MLCALMVENEIVSIRRRVPFRMLAFRFSNVCLGIFISCLENGKQIFPNQVDIGLVE